MWLLLKGLLIASTVTVLPMVIEPFWKPKEALFFVIGMTFISCCWLMPKKDRYEFDNKWLSCIFIYIVLSFGTIFYLPLVFDKHGVIVYELWNLLPSLNLILGILMIYHLVEHTDTVNRWISVMKVICWLGVGVSLYAISQRLGWGQLFSNTSIFEGAVKDKLHRPEYLMFTFLGNKMLSSNLIACTTPLFLVFKKPKYYVGLAICLGTLYLYKSTFNLGAAVLGVLLVLFLQRKWKVGLVCLISLIMLCVVKGDFDKSTFSGRLEQWQVTWDKSNEYFWTGRGAGSFPRDFAYVENKEKRWSSSHNLLLDIKYEFGMIGLILFAGYLLNLFRRTANVFYHRNESLLLIGLCGALFSYGIISMGSFVHRIAPLALLGIVFLSGIEVNLSKRRIA